MADDDKKEEVAAPVVEDTTDENKAPADETKEAAPKSSVFSKLCGCFSKKGDAAAESKEVKDDKVAEPTEKAEEQDKPEQAQPVTAE